MRKTPRIECRKAKNDADFERARAFNARPIAIRVGEPLQGTPCRGKDLNLPEEHKEIARLLNPIAIEFNGRYWKK